MSADEARRRWRQVRSVPTRPLSFADCSSPGGAAALNERRCQMALQSRDVLQVRKGFVLVIRVVSYLIYFYVIVVEIILVIGFFLLLFGANPTAGFTQWAYRNLDRVMEPFRGIFTPIQLGTTSGNVEAVFDTSVLFAMIVYLIIGMLLSALTRWLSQRLRYLDAAEADAKRREQQERAEADMQASSVTPTATDTATIPPTSGASSA
jgi:hypothetical protein